MRSFGLSLLAAAIVSTSQAEESVVVEGSVPVEVLGLETPDAFAARVRDVVAPIDYAIVASCAEQRLFQLRAGPSFPANDMVSSELAEEGKSVWIIEVLAWGCNAGRLHNIFAFPRQKEPALLVAGFPGHTQASLGLQADALRALTDNAATFSPGCTSEPVVIDTRVVDNSEEGKPWAEEWSLRYCNKPRRVKAIFTPGPEGVSLNLETLS